MQNFLAFLLVLCLCSSVALPVFAQKPVIQGQETLISIPDLAQASPSVQARSSLVLTAQDSETKAWTPPGPVWLLSALVPGLGQVMMGHPTRGYFFLLGCVLAYPIGLLTSAITSLSGNADITTHFILAATVGGSLFGITYIWNLYDANQIYLEQLLEAQKSTAAPNGKKLSYFPLWTYQGQF